jgi:outer membrane protease
VDHHKKSIAFFICFVSLFCAAAAHGETRIFNRPYAFSLTPQLGFIHGTSYEIVYQDIWSSEYLSELQWELKPLFVLGLGVSLEPLKTSGFFTSFSINAGLPERTGNMEDRDWNIPGTLTNFSSHTNKLKAAFLLTLDAGYSFSVTDWFFIRLFGSLDYFYFKMEGRDGYTSYASNNWENIYLSGTVITYFQHWFLFSPGICYGFTPGRFTIKGTINITPLIYCFDTDDHVSRKVRFLDYMYGKLAVKPALDIALAITPRITLGIGCSYIFIAGTRGDTIVEYYTSNSPSEKIYNSAGAGLSLFNIALYTKFTL